MRGFLDSTSIIDWQTPAIRDLASQLRDDDTDPVAITRRCFEWVRDRILHTSDHSLDPITCAASDVLAHGTGFCYAKSHLLAALLRANGIPAGFAYQRFSLGDGTFCLHGLNAVWLPEFGWCRLDARGNRVDLSATFDPPVDHLPFATTEKGEATFAGIWSEPLRCVVDALQTYRLRTDLLEHLPDAEEETLPDAQAAVK